MQLNGIELQKKMFLQQESKSILDLIIIICLTLLKMTCIDKLVSIGVKKVLLDLKCLRQRHK